MQIVSILSGPVLNEYESRPNLDLFGLMLSDLKDAVENPDEKSFTLKRKKTKIPRYYYFCVEIAEPLREYLTELENSLRIIRYGLIWADDEC